jgi:agmatine/peptidylarginine deiminase
LKIPCAVHEAENDTSARRIYLNFLNLKNRILMPWFEDEKFERTNSEAKEQLETVFKKNVDVIPCDELAKQGGIINCITWSILNNYIVIFYIITYI